MPVIFNFFYQVVSKPRNHDVLCDRWPHEIFVFLISTLKSKTKCLLGDDLIILCVGNIISQSGIHVQKDSLSNETLKKKTISDFPC